MTLVESALVLGIFLVLLFGIFEYCRFLLVLHVTTNASRDGARYASVNWDKPSTFNKTNYTDANGRDHALVFETTVAGKKVNGCDFLHFNDDGLIDDFMVMVRPLSGATARTRARRMGAPVSAATTTPFSTAVPFGGSSPGRRPRAGVRWPPAGWARAVVVPAAVSTTSAKTIGSRQGEIIVLWIQLDERPRAGNEGLPARD